MCCHVSSRSVLHPGDLIATQQFTSSRPFILIATQPAGKLPDLDPVTLVATNNEIRAAALLEVVDQIIAGSAPQG